MAKEAKTFGVGDLAEKTGKEAADVRAWLRRQKIQKADGQYVFTKDELETHTKAIKAGGAKATKDEKPAKAGGAKAEKAEKAEKSKKKAA